MPRQFSTHTCETCGKVFQTYRIRNPNRFCSNACRWQGLQTLDIPKAFWPHVASTDNPDDCWLWMMARGTRGYGQFTAQSKMYLTHRLAYALTYGPIPPGMYVCHRCDNPPCCNPSHLFLGTPAENARDTASKGRTLRGERASSSKLKNEQVLEIRQLIQSRVPYNAIARTYSVTPRVIRLIALGETWTHVK